jgi:hypothetical protein
MEVIIIADDDLNRLEKRFGPAVRRMGSWNSDGTFGYVSVPLTAVEEAAEALENPDLATTVSRLRITSEPDNAFIELLESFGPVLIERIAEAYRKCSAKVLCGTFAAH